MSYSVREEEVCQILSLKEKLDYSEVLVRYAAKYLQLGWDLVAVNLNGEPALDLDFRQSRKLWAEKLTHLGLEGVQVNLGVRAGAPSRLLVLEVHRQKSAPPFNQRGEWCSGCVAEVGREREQHYYVLPKGWQAPASFFLEAFQIMVFGEGGVVLAPPSLEPQARSTLKWLRPPWESPPTRPSPGLCKFIRAHAPVLPRSPLNPEPEVLPWEAVYPVISSHPEVLKALLAPAASSDSYYRQLLKAAKTAGLQDPQTLLGLLWHAPFGNSSSRPRRPEALLSLISQGMGEDFWQDEEPEPEASRWLPPGRHSEGEARENGLPDFSRESFSPKGDGPAAPSGLVTEGLWPADERPGNGRRTSLSAGTRAYEAWGEACPFPQESLIVERRRYEAMIYELGKLGALTDFYRREHRQHKALRDRLETQWMRELEYLRQLVAKKTKKGWYLPWKKD